VRRRPWTRLGVLSIAGHLGYELVAGVGVPGASRVGVTLASGSYAAATLATFRTAGTMSTRRADRGFAVANGVFLSAVIGHLTSWPRTTRAGLPWLTECEGLSGRLMAGYNAVLYVSGVAAVGGLIENRSAWRWGALTPVIVVPLFRWASPLEYAALLADAADHPRWWNRRLAARTTAAAQQR
jgi:hypothetical protein